MGDYPDQPEEAGYAERFFRTAFAPTVRWLDVAAIVLTPIAKAAGGNVVTDEQIALWILYFVGAALAVRVVSAPYLIWREDQATIKELKNEVARPERERNIQRQVRADLNREELWGCATKLLNKTRDFMHTYSASRNETKPKILEEWHSERARFTEKAEEFGHLRKLRVARGRQS